MCYVVLNSLGFFVRWFFFDCKLTCVNDSFRVTAEGLTAVFISTSYLHVFTFHLPPRAPVRCVSNTQIAAVAASSRLRSKWATLR